MTTAPSSLACFSVSYSLPFGPSPLLKTANFPSKLLLEGDMRETGGRMISSTKDETTVVKAVASLDG